MKRDQRGELERSVRDASELGALLQSPGAGPMLLALLLLLLCVACGGPMLVFPGGALAGDVVTEPVENWSFVSDAVVSLETRPDDPYSVDLNYIVRDGKLYLDPVEGRRWFELLKADPNVRVRFDGKVYPVTAVLVGEPGELEGFDPERFIYRLDSRSE